MADLAKLKELFTEAQTEINGLDKQKSSLTQEITTLTARVRFLTTAITELEAKQLTAKKLLIELTAGATSKSKALETRIRDMEAELRGLAQNKAEIVASIEETRTQSEEEMEEATLRALNKQAELKATSQAIIEAKDTLAEVTQEIVDSKQAAKVLDEQIPQKIAEVASETASLEAELDIARTNHQTLLTHIDDKRDILEELDAKLLERQADVDAFERRKRDFEALEQRTIKILESREAALVNKEADLERRSRRNPSILGNS